MSSFEKQLGKNYDQQVAEFENLLRLKLEAVIEGATLSNIQRVYYRGVLLSLLLPCAWNDKLACVPLPGNNNDVFVTSTARLAVFARNSDGLIQRYFYITARQLPPKELRASIDAMRAL